MTEITGDWLDVLSPSGQLLDAVGIQLDVPKSFTASSSATATVCPSR